MDIVSGSKASKPHFDDKHLEIAVLASPTYSPSTPPAEFVGDPSGRKILRFDEEQVHGPTNFQYHLGGHASGERVFATHRP